MLTQTFTQAHIQTYTRACTRTNALKAEMTPFEWPEEGPKPRKAKTLLPGGSARPFSGPPGISLSCSHCTDGNLIIN